MFTMAEIFKGKMIASERENREFSRNVDAGHEVQLGTAN